MSESRTARVPLIWIVDDSKTNRAMTQHALGTDYAFEQFADGSEVVERLAGGRERPDVMLLDWMMPGMSGDEVCRFVRADAALRDLPIVLVTASRVETTDVVAGLALGANDYVARPFAPEELRARIKSVLRAKELGDISVRERLRLAAINRLGRALFETGPHIDQILDQLAIALTTSICDGCSILLLPGELSPAVATRHHADPSAEALAAIATVADPAVHLFTSSAHALETLPPAYHPYVERFGLRSLAILPFPTRAPVQGIVTVTRDGASEPLAPDDLATIETCIEYASLAVQNAMRFDAERSARLQLHAVVDNAPVGIVVIDNSGTLRLANPIATALVPGIDHPAQVARVLGAAGWLSEDGSPIAAPEGVLERALHALGPTRTQLTLPGLDGVPHRIVEIAMVPLRDDSQLVGRVMTIQDVTSARAFAAERERIALFQEQMLGIVGHDLRSPLGAIMAGADIIEITGGAVPGVQAVVDRIRSSAHRMTHIIEQLLDVTRARLGAGIPIAAREISLVDVARGVLDELALAHPAARLELTCTGPATGHWDPERLGQVVSNLVSNAIQYGRPAAPILVEVGVTAATAHVQIANFNRGAAIDRERLAGLFEPYQRGEAREHHTGGLGLGLYIVREIVQAHQGTVSATSDAVRTVFRVELPLPGA